MGRATFAILAVLCCTWAVAEQAVNPPPRPLHKVGDHWTPYTPPTDFPPDVQVYTIQKGDTLWALAKRFMGNPYLWPQLWEKNKYIRDAHWIYPGDPLVIGPKTEEVAPSAPAPKVEFKGVVESLPPGGGLVGDWKVSGRTVHVTPSTAVDQAGGAVAPGATVEVEGAGEPDGTVNADTVHVVAPAGGAGAAGGQGEAGAAGQGAAGAGAGAGAGGAGAAGAAPGGEGAAGTLVAIGSEDDVYCFAYLDDKDTKPSLTITSAEQIEYQDNFATGDIVYVSGGDAEGVKAGQEFFIVQPLRKLRHPATNAVLGTVMRQLGHARILCTQDHSATAEILSSCDAINVGAWLTPFDAIPIPMTVLTPPVTRCDPASTKPKGYLVYSRDDDIYFGQDHLVLVDLGDADQVSPGTQAIVFRENPVAGAPRLLLGEIAVLTTGSHWASAKVIRSSAPMQVGDRVELK
ncbi:MAG TPA: DUF5666 domain-containing protein [Thermoanaerobaculaceae bacterium]|nr:DUF5666 domain-containing protein [Thermoanaerobaculaceae bacterium]